MKDADSSFNAEEFMKRHQQFSTADAGGFRNVVDKTITWGRVEASVKVYLTNFLLSVADKVV